MCFEVELKPYLIRFTQCDVCQKTRARNFRPQRRCYKYMCESCWQHAQVDLDNNNKHLPMVCSPPVRARLTTNDSSMKRIRNSWPFIEASRVELWAPRKEGCISASNHINESCVILYGLQSFRTTANDSSECILAWSPDYDQRLLLCFG
ncbi:hypothetical protein V3C99_006063 [Haemonchus contortus]